MTYGFQYLSDLATNSRLICISIFRNYLNCNYGLHEFWTAHVKMVHGTVHGKGNCLVIVKLDQVDSSDERMPPSMWSHMDGTTYIDGSKDDEKGIARTQYQLKKAMASQVRPLNISDYEKLGNITNYFIKCYRQWEN